MPPRILTETAVLKHPGTPTAYIFSLIDLPLPNPFVAIRLQAPIFVYSASDGTVNLVSVSNPKSNGKEILTHSAANGPIKTGTSALIPFKVRKSGSTGTHAVCKSGFVTGGRDGKVQVWAVEGNEGVPEGGYQVGLAGEVATPNGQVVSALAANHERSLLVAGTELEGDGPGDVAVHIWSYTNLSTLQLLHSYTDSHTDTITSLHFHIPAPFTPHLADTPAHSQLHLLSCSTDGLINIYDPSLADEDDAVLVVLNNKAAVSHVSSVLVRASPAAPRAPAICAISHDEKFGVFEIEDVALGGNGQEREEGAESTEWPALDLRQALKADYAIGLRPRGLTEAEYGYLGKGMVLATGTNKEETLASLPGEDTPFVDLFLVAPVRAGVAAAVEGTAGAATAGFQSAVRLKGAHGEEIVRDVWFEETAPFVLTVGEDGCVRLWSDEEGAVERGERSEKEDVDMAGVGDEDVGGEKPSRAEKRQKRKEKRHKPY